MLTNEKIEIAFLIRLFVNYTYFSMNFDKHLKKYLSDEEINALCNSFGQKEHKGLILNTNKINDEEFIKMFPNVKKHPLVPHAYLYDQNEYPFGKMIHHELGLYYIQDPSAALVSYLLNPKEDENVLDMCAAPGGKSVQASLLMKNKGVLYANDLSFKRSLELLSNVERLGLSNVFVTSLDLSKVKGLTGSFDKIILDAPCSGSGMFNKDKKMFDDWSYEKVLKCAKVQKELITLAYSFLKEGGTMVYSTCSYSYEEDEEVVKYLLENTDATLLTIQECEGFYRSDLKETIHLYPHKFFGEGHFIALIKKRGELTKNKINPYESKEMSDSKGNSKVIKHYLLPNEPLKALKDKAIRPGLFTYQEISKEKIYSHHYSHFITNLDESYPLSDEELKKYLHGESLTISPNNKKYSFVSYLGYNLGIVKKVNDVLKNYYPKGLRH